MLDDRFWTKVDKKSQRECWVWVANRNNKGYGLFRPGGSAPKQLAHRLSYEHHYGPIPKGRLVLHSCDNPRCVNPSHLRIGGHKENVADMDARGRRVLGPCRGEDNGQTTKTEADIIAIRQDYVYGVPIGTILTKHKISRAAFSDYVSGRSWAHILGIGGCPGIHAIENEAMRRRRSSARITRKDAETIRKRLSAGERGVDLAAEYGVHNATISDIKHRKIWR